MSGTERALLALGSSRPRVAASEAPVTIPLRRLHHSGVPWGTSVQERGSLGSAGRPAMGRKRGWEARASGETPRKYKLGVWPSGVVSWRCSRETNLKAPSSERGPAATLSAWARVGMGLRCDAQAAGPAGWTERSTIQDKLSAALLLSPPARVMGEICSEQENIHYRFGWKTTQSHMKTKAAQKHAKTCQHIRYERHFRSFAQLAVTL